MNPESETAALDRLLETEGAPPEGEFARAAWLRRHLPPEAAARAAGLLALRERARGKFERAERLWLTPHGLEQATRPEVAAARARRIAELARGALVLDATCGLGADAGALARAGLAVVAADRDPEAARCARHNLAVWGLEASVVRADVLRPPLRERGEALLVVDPSRRPDGRRILAPEAWSPAWPPSRGCWAGFVGPV
ncbi:MAG: class I SAM-dependent methyltransferase [Planctomycetota bacterium]